MKNTGLITFILIVTTAICHAQSKEDVVIPAYYKSVMDYTMVADGSADINTKPINADYHLRQAEHAALASKYTKHTEYIELGNNIWQQSGQNARHHAVPNILRITIPFKGEEYPLVLKRRYLKTKEYTLTTSSSTNRKRSNNYYYHGIVEGDYQSWVTLSIIDGQYRVLIASRDGNIEVQKPLHTSQNDQTYYIYEADDLKHIEEYTCHTEDEKVAQRNGKSESRSVGSDCIELYIECDHQSYLDNGSSVNATEAWAMSIMNDVATIYNTIDIPLVVNNITIWNSPDPYTNATSLQAVRDSFAMQIQNSYDGRVAQLFSTRDLGGGLAYGIGGLCGAYPDFPAPYSIATSLATSYAAFPNYSFTVNVVAHELGHVFGARHTHACVWGAGFDSQIDDCGNVYASDNGNQPEGQECFDPSNPILPVSGGTIMSFCNLAGGGIDLSNGFGTEVGDYIYDQFLAAPCATGDQCASIPPTNDDCANATAILANGICNLMTYDNILASASGIGDPSCGNIGIGIDVWFSFEATSTNLTLEFDPVSNGVEDVVISLYEGGCGALTELRCTKGNGTELSFSMANLVIGDIYYIRLIEEGSDEFGAFEICLVDASLPCHPAIGPLVDLYNSTNGPNWNVNTGWEDGAAGTDCAPCAWYGITCDNKDNIIGVNLFNNNLDGNVPISLGEVITLRTLKLMNNDLDGTFPDIWTNLSVLEFLDLSNNNFTGQMPVSLGDLQKIKTLYIENNNIGGVLLPGIADLPLIDVYWTKNNNLTGCYPDNYQALCGIASTKFTGNPLLPSGGNNFETFCSQGLGGDIDNDGFCFGQGIGEDCVDNDNTIYPNAPELCDGKDNDCNGAYDEGLVETNIWLANGGGNWNQSTNWSLGVVPEGCHDVVLPAAGTSRTINISSAALANARSVSIFDNNILNNNGELRISGSSINGLNISSAGTCNNGGVMEVINIFERCIETSGSLVNGGSVIVENLGTNFEIYIYQDADLINDGLIMIK